MFRLALRQTEGLIGSVIGLLGLDLAVPDHSTLCRRAEALVVPRPRTSAGAEPMDLLVDSTGLKLCGAGKWLHEKHGTKLRRSWRKLHLGMDAGTGKIVASLLTTEDVDDGSQIGPLLDQFPDPIASFTGDGVLRSGRCHRQRRCPPSRSGYHRAAARKRRAERDGRDALTQRDRHLQHITEHGRMASQAASGYTKRARAETSIARFKQVIGDGLRSHTDERQAAEVEVAVQVLNRMLELGRPNSVRIA